MISDDQPSLPLPRPLPESLRPQRLTLRLPDGFVTGLYVHRPRGPRRTPVVYLHGIQSHPGWFAGSAAHLAAAGHAVYMPVRRGSGAARQNRGDARSARQLFGDLDAACSFIVEEAGAAGLHAVGVSWGGKLLAAYAALRGAAAPLVGLTLVAPGIVPRVDLPAGQKLRVAAALLCCPRRRFGIPLSDPALFTDNEAMREYLRRDPFRLTRATARFLYASRRLDRMLRRLPTGRLRQPTTLILAGRDRIINSAATRAAVDRLTGGRAKVVELDAAHTLDFEPDPGPSYEALAQSVAR